MKQIVTKETMAVMLRIGDDSDSATQHRKKVVGRALVALMARQTELEKRANTTEEHNGVGFAGPDARQATITAKTFLKKGTLEDFQLEAWMRDFRGNPRIMKYSTQLNEIANERLAKMP